jgi:manganese-dependent inorganic pyrophosphatase
MKKSARKVIVIGHLNPDTDSICSAIAYSYLKNQEGELETEPRRAGEINQETAFVLNYFGIDPPRLCTDVSPQIQDIEYRHMPGIDISTSVHKAWELMRSENIDTLPIISANNEMQGIVTLNDVSDACMDVLDTQILAASHTPYRNILEVLDGEMLVGDPDGTVETGKLGLAAGNPEAMEDFIEPGDMMILSSRYEFQFCALEMGAGCLIICSKRKEDKVPKTIQKLAEERNCTVIITPKDFYSTAKLLSLATPVGHYMRKDVLTFSLNTPLDEVQKIMAQVRYHYFPILTRGGKYAGLLSRRNLMNMKRRQLILVDHNEKTQAIEGFEEADILEIIDHHRIGSMETSAPVYFRNVPVGCTATIVFHMFREHNVEIPQKIAGLLLAAILSDTLMFRSPTSTIVDETAARELAGIAGIDIEGFANQMFEAGGNVEGKTPQEVFLQDFKIFKAGDTRYGVGQGSYMSMNNLNAARDLLLPYLPEAAREQGLSDVFYMLTNVRAETTYLLFYGDQALDLVRSAFPEVQIENNVAILPGVVSRKKQVLPAFVSAFSQI